MLKRFYALLLLVFLIHVCLFNYKVFASSSDISAEVSCVFLSYPEKWPWLIKAQKFPKADRINNEY